MTDAPAPNPTAETKVPELTREQARRWQDDNAAFIDAYNASVEKDGLVLATYRQF